MLREVNWSFDRLGFLAPVVTLPRRPWNAEGDQVSCGCFQITFQGSFFQIFLPLKRYCSLSGFNCPGIKVVVPWSRTYAAIPCLVRDDLPWLSTAQSPALIIRFTSRLVLIYPGLIPIGNPENDRFPDREMTS